MSLPTLPENAPFSAEQRAWINGYLAGLFSQNSPAPVPSPTALPAPALGPLVFLYGSQTGSAEGLAKKFAREAGRKGFAARALGMESHGELDFSRETRLCIVTSTYGDGEMPDNAQTFWDSIRNGTAPRFDHVEFSVLALGDKNYTQFCEAGIRFDQRLEELGAKRAVPRVDCDVDYDATAQAWFEALMQAFGGNASSSSAAEVAEAAPQEPYGKSRPFPALLKGNRLLNGEGSAKETRHFEIVLNGSGLEYEAGDALGVMPQNCPDFVQQILDAAGLDGEEEVAVGEEKAALRKALTEYFDLKPFLATLPARGVAATELIASLRKLQPRLYSIASSPKAHPGEVHLTVGIVRYEAEGRSCKGVCSTFLADRVGEGSVPVFVHKSPHFRLPVDTDKPVIMVGPGTGIAPFRAFLEERKATGARGKNWLFFGDQRAETDYLYRAELEAMRDQGFLTRLDLAFSRDQAEKIYVQHRMLAAAEEMWAWLQEGAFFYVCGDAKRMAKDVDAALHQVIQMAGGLGSDDAAGFVKTLKAEKRYLRDVY